VDCSPTGAQTRITCRTRSTRSRRHRGKAPEAAAQVTCAPWIAVAQEHIVWAGKVSPPEPGFPGHQIASAANSRHEGTHHHPWWARIGGRTFEFTRTNTTPTILRKEFEDLRGAHALVRFYSDPAMGN